MKTTNAKHQFRDMSRDYNGLVKCFAPRPIHDKVGYDNIVEIIDAMVLFHDEFTADQEDYFDLLCQLVESYEKENVKWPKREPTALDCLKHLLAENKMSSTDLANLLHVNRSLGGMILRGDRRLTADHIRILSKRFAVSADLFLN